MTGYAVKTADLSVRYGSTVALSGVDLDLAPGRIHGLLGRNGTGKTTLLSTLASLRRPHTGSVRSAAAVGQIGDLPARGDTLGLEAGHRAQR